jgi:glyoxylase-like metal-dependent hydrolase (beta-lactamase superfamily II)
VTSEDEKAPIEQALLNGARVGRVARDGETFDLGGVTLETVYAPGHTMGSLCVFHRQQRALFTGDNVLGSGSTAIHPHEGDMGLYIRSLERLTGCGAQVIYPGHGAPVRDAQAKLRELISHRLEREQQVLDCLRRGKGTVEAIFGELYPELEGRLHNMAREQIRSHLAKLVKEGKAAASADGASYTII